jgi:hypothetical protein
MKFEDWQIGQWYDVMTGASPYPLGQLVQKYQIDQIVALDFRKEDGGEYLYLVDDTETYVIHKEPGEAQDTLRIEPPLMSADRG